MPIAGDECIEAVLIGSQVQIQSGVLAPTKPESKLRNATTSTVASTAVGSNPGGDGKPSSRSRRIVSGGAGSEALLQADGVVDLGFGQLRVERVDSSRVEMAFSMECVHGRGGNPTRSYARLAP